jgi:hypothetical protein
MNLLLAVDVRTRPDFDPLFLADCAAADALQERLRAVPL